MDVKSLLLYCLHIKNRSNKPNNNFIKVNREDVEESEKWNNTKTAKVNSNIKKELDFSLVLNKKMTVDIKNNITYKDVEKVSNLYTYAQGKSETSKIEPLLDGRIIKARTSMASATKQK